jgi:hypothetical protein
MQKEIQTYIIFPCACIIVMEFTSYIEDVLVQYVIYIYTVEL